MSALIGWDEVTEGEALPGLQVALRRTDLVMYAGASGDFNPIHWSDRVARAAGLPDVIAHGMLTMAQAGRVVTDWVGDPGAVVSYSLRFSRPVPVPDDDEGVVLQIDAVVAEKLPRNRVRIDITAAIPGSEGQAVDVVKQANAVVQL